MLKSRRFATWWIGWNDLNWPNQDNYDKIKARAAKLAEAKVTSVIIFGTHFRWDYLPVFPLLHDYLAAVAEELHKDGMELIDHHSVNLIHRYSTREEMRHVMLHSGPHLPFSPTREAAATWEYQGKRLNDWRMIDVKTGQVLWYPQYASEGFCHRNPEFIEAYQHYAKTLIADTGIDGLMADDPVHYMRMNSCACPYCRKELKRRTGIELPPVEDQTFWGNWDNPAWKHWVDLRFDATGEFMRAVQQVLPENFLLMSCGASSAMAGAVGLGSDIRQFLRGANYGNMEMSGNTPAYKHDPVTVNVSIPDRVINASHHQAAAKEKGARCYGTGYGFTEASANIIWAVNKVLGADCWFSTLKARLGLPDHILNGLPDEADCIGRAFRFEDEHPTLFSGEQIGQAAVYFSYETRNHTCFGAMSSGYYKDYRCTLDALFRKGISTHTVFCFPENADEYPLVLLPSAAAMTQEELQGMRKFLAAGGTMVATGPSAIPKCEHLWNLPNRPDTAPIDFFSTIRDGVWIKHPRWMESELSVSSDPDVWQTPVKGLFYHPHRMSEEKVTQQVLELSEQYGKPLPLKVLACEGYLVTMFRGKEGITVHLLAANYDTDIDHHLDEIRYHRSRINYINAVEPIGVAQVIRVESKTKPEVYLPLNDVLAQVDVDAGICTIRLPEKCSYVLMHFKA